MSSPTDSDFRSVLPINATGLDLIDRFQLSVDSLYPTDHLVTSVFEANDYLSSLYRRLGAPPRTPNGSYFAFSVGNYLLLLRRWISTATDDIRGVTQGGARGDQGVTQGDAAISSQTVDIRGVTQVGARGDRGVTQGDAATISQTPNTRSVTQYGATAASLTQNARSVTQGGATTASQT
jgi:hypothetical protein